MIDHFVPRGAMAIFPDILLIWCDTSSLLNHLTDRPTNETTAIGQSTSIVTFTKLNQSLRPMTLILLLVQFGLNMKYE